MSKNRRDYDPAAEGERAVAREAGEIRRLDEKIKIDYLLGGYKDNIPQAWEGTKKEAMEIALAEIHEHAGGSSAAYIFTKAIFDAIG